MYLSAWFGSQDVFSTGEAAHISVQGPCQTTRSSDNGRAKLKLNFMLGDFIVGFGGLACSAGGWWLCAVGRPTPKRPYA
jgi:hypothetical protein